jgi:hypothetical protein
MSHKVAATLSLRPKEFKRENFAASLHKNENEKFAESALKSLRTGNINSIMEHCVLDKFEKLVVEIRIALLMIIHYLPIIRTKYKRETEILQLEEQDRLKQLEDRRVFRDTNRNKLHTLQETHKHKTQDLVLHWRESQLVKYNRQKRDLQFEMVQNRIEQYQKLRQDQLHKQTEIHGIDEFEKNMKRMGLGVQEDADSRLNISYETNEAYQQRMALMNQEQFPTHEEIDNFKTQLKERTNAKKQARYEKAKRRRRALLEQATALQNTTTT